MTRSLCLCSYMSLCRALTEQSQPGQQYALWLVHALIRLEQQASRWLGWQAVAAVRSTLAAVRDAAVVAQGMHPAVLDMPDGFASLSPPTGRSPAGRHTAHRGWMVRLQHALLSAQASLSAAASRQHQLDPRGGEGRAGGGSHKQSASWWEALGADRVDTENLVLTCLMGALAAVLWLHVRQQGLAAAQARGQAQQAPQNGVRVAGVRVGQLQEGAAGDDVHEGAAGSTDVQQQQLAATGLRQRPQPASDGSDGSPQPQEEEPPRPT